MSKTVTYKMNLNNPPILSEEQKARLEALAKRPDSEIDFSEKAQGKGYQTRMNKILRDAMLNELKNHP